MEQEALYKPLKHALAHVLVTALFVAAVDAFEYENVAEAEFHVQGITWPNKSSEYLIIKLLKSLLFFIVLLWLSVFFIFTKVVNIKYVLIIFLSRSVFL